MYTCLKHYIWKLQVFFPNFVVCKKILIYSYTIIITFMLTKKAFKIFYYYTIIMRIVTENNGNYKKTSKVIILITIKGIWRKMCLHLNKLECRGKVYGLSLWRILHKTDTFFFFENCWPSIHLLYMYSIFGRGSFCFNHCLNPAWHGGDQFVALLRWFGSPGFFDSGLQLICIFWSLVSHFPLDNIPYILYRVQVWRVCWPVKHTDTMVI